METEGGGQREEEEKREGRVRGGDCLLLFI